MPDGLAWVDEAELEQIAQMRSALADELAGALPELQHDHWLARFLRGHGELERAIDKLRGAIKYRTELSTKEPYRTMRAACAEATSLDLSVLPHSEFVLRHLPMRTVEGGTADGLPIALSVTRLFVFKSFSDEEDAKLDEFLRAMIEQRALIVHNLSVREKRMVKCVDLRDLTGISVAEIVRDGREFIARMQRFISMVQDFYPELIHKAFVFNASPAFSQLFTLVSPILNARMRSKVKVFPLGGAFAELGMRLQPRAAWSWITQATAGLQYERLDVANGTMEYAARWLEAGQAASWTLAFTDDSSGNEVKLRTVFFPATAAAAADAAAAAADADAADAPDANLDLASAATLGTRERDGGAGDRGGGGRGVGATEVAVRADRGAHTGRLAASDAGLLLLCVDNYDAWWYPVRVSLAIDVQ